MNASTPLSQDKQQGTQRGRKETRIVRVYAIKSLPSEWQKSYPCRVIQVERLTTRQNKTTHTQHVYLSNLHCSSAHFFAQGIRGHWAIENYLHWVKDVFQHEDSSHIKRGNGIETLSLLKNIALNLSRQQGFSSIKQAQLFFSTHFLSHLFPLLKRT